MKKYKLFENIYYWGDIADTIDSDRCYSVAGYGIADGVFLCQDDDPQKVATVACNFNELQDLGERLRGTITIAVVRKSQETIHILPDPLHSAPIYYCKTKNGIAYSSDLNRLLDFNRIFFEALEKNPAFVGQIMACGITGYIPTAFKGVFALNPFEYLVVSSDGPKTCEYNFSEEIHSSFIDERVWLEKTKNDFLENVTALSAVKAENKICHLTGGYDSRLVLGSLLAAGIENEYCFHTFKEGKPQDLKIAHSLARHYNLEIAEIDGLNLRYYTRNPEDLAFLNLSASAGHLSYGIANLMKSSTLTISGGYGEILRSLYNHGARFLQTSPLDIARRIHGRYGFAAGDEALLTPQFKNYLATELVAVAKHGTDRGIREDGMYDYVYDLRRSRFWYGGFSLFTSYNSVRVDPLYSPFALALAMKTRGRKRDANVYGFSILNSFSPGLGNLPFDGYTIPELYGKSGGSMRQRKFQNLDSALKTRPVKMEHLDLECPKLPELYHASPRHKEDELTELASRLGISRSDAMRFSRAQDGLSYMLDNGQLAPLEDVINLEQLKKYTKVDADSAHAASIVSRAYDYLTWFVNI